MPWLRSHRPRKFHVKHPEEDVAESPLGDAIDHAPAPISLVVDAASASTPPIDTDTVDLDDTIDAATKRVITAPPAVASAPQQPSVAPRTSTFAPIDDTPLARELADITRRRQAMAIAQLPLPPSTRIFTVANQKGGVGKTTTTVNLAAALARHGARVLVIDLDPQGNASTALGVEHRSDTVSVYDVIINDEPMADVVQKSPEFAALYCLPATIHLAGAEIELVSLVAREQRLRTALDAFLAQSPEQFHYVFIDCPPSLGLLTINAFVAAREVLIPIQCEYYALEGLSQLLKNISLIEKHLNPQLTVSTILLTMYDSRTNLANQVVQDVREHFPDQALQTLIPRSVRISEAPSYGQTVISYDGNSAGSLSYLEAAAEIARRGAPE
jgi:chromosome partitioning protein